MEIDESEYSVRKVVTIGDCGVGKTSIVSRIVNNTFTNSYRPTIGCDFLTVTDRERKEILQLWDTAGQERFQGLSVGYYRHTTLFIMVYDITSRVSFDNLNNWLEEMNSNKNKNQEAGVIVVGAKKDMGHKRVVSVEEGENWSKIHNFMFMEYSSKEGSAVEIKEKISEALDKLSFSS